MKSIIKVFTIICFLGLSTLSSAQEILGYRSQKLAQMWSELSAKAPSEDSSNISFQGQRVVATIEQGVLTHLGVDIFGDGIKDGSDRPVMEFCERYLLEMLLSDDPQQQSSFDEVAIVGDINSIPNLLSGENLNLSLGHSNGLFSVEWSSGASSFSVQFPIDYSLLSGLSKIELENLFAFDLGRFSCSEEPQKSSIDASRLSLVDDVYRYDGGYYMNEQVQHLEFFKAEGNTFAHLESREHPLEMLYNLVSTTDLDSDITLEVEQQKYGFKLDKYSCKLRDLIALSQEQGCKAYMGIESVEDGRVTASLFLVNSYFKYNHMLSIIINSNVLSSRAGSGVAKVNAYIPLQNLSDIYDDDAQTNSKHKIKL